MTPVIEELIPLFNAMQDNTLVLTPNERLRRFIQQQYAQFQQLQSRQAWPTLPVYSLNGWLQSLWVSLQQSCYGNSDKILLSPVQEGIIWEQIIRQHSQGYELLNPRQTATVARDAWHKLLQWQLDPDQISSHQIDAILFKRWISSYRQHCRTRKLTDSSQNINVMKLAVSESRLSLPKAIVMYGFDVVSPLTRSLLDEFSKHGVNVHPVNIEKSAEVRRVELADEDSEIIAAARWAAHLLANHKEPESLQIGIVVPQLTQLRARVERHFNTIFEPQYLFINNPRHVTGFNMSVAIPLGETPAVSAALNLLQLNRSQIDMELTSHILRSPFIGSMNELSQRALLDVDLRAAYMTMDPGRLRGATARLFKNDKGVKEFRCPDLYRRLQEFYQLSWASQSRQQLPNDWLKLFAAQLSALGWPGERSLDSEEHQQVSHWQDVLQSMAGLDTISGPCNVATALAHINTLAHQYPFHARTAQSPIQILGLLEAAGMLFDHVWVMNMDSHSWPVAPAPNPLISIRKQVELKMPNASVDVELQFAKAMTERLAGAAGDVIFSHSSYHGDQALRPSPLIEKYQSIRPEQLQLIPVIDYHQELSQSPALSEVIDDRGPGITDAAAIKGGTQILKDQAACPFRSFAKHRMHAKEIEQVLPGLSPMEHGILIHRALEIIWLKLGEQDNLMKLSEGELAALINAAVADSFSSLPNHKVLGTRLRDLQEQRMVALIHAWLVLEKQRQPFSVAFNENTRNIELANLPLQVRYDRIDQLQDGSFFVIDYKTGHLDIKYWSGSRPDEPQVPIYCIANENISAAAFGILNASEVGFKGIAESKTLAPGLKQPDTLTQLDLPDNWQDIMHHWRNVMESLAQDFIDGAAAVGPKSITTSCRYCALPGLCRIRELTKGDGIIGENHNAE